MCKKVVVFVADGSEDIETTIVVDVLRRADIDVCVASVTNNLNIKLSNGISIVADKNADEIDFSNIDLLVLPGGMPGTINLENCEIVREQVTKFSNEGKFVAAICAAPIILGKLGLLDHKNATCYPGFESELTGANYTAKKVEVDENIITANGPGSAFEFAYVLVEKLLGGDCTNTLKNDMQY